MESTGLHLKLKEQFCTCANELTQLFKCRMDLEKHARCQGAKDAYGELLEWLLRHGQGELKFVQMSSLLPLLEEKIRSSDKQEYNYPEHISPSLGGQSEIELPAAGGTRGESSHLHSPENPKRQGAREGWNDCSMMESETSPRPIFSCKKRGPHN